MRNASVFILLSVFLFLVGCVGPGDLESLDSVKGGGALYERDVMGGLTPQDAEARIDSLVERYSKATAPEDGADEVAVRTHEAQVEAFRIDLSVFYVDELSYSLALEFFEAAVRYELSLFPPDERPSGPAPPDAGN